MTLAQRKSSIINQVFKTPRWLVILIAFTIFVIEFSIMVMLHMLSPLKSLVLAFIDSLLLLILVAPELYLLVFKPMITYIADLKKAKDDSSRAEERYRNLFSTLYEGSCTIDIVFDENQHPVDFRFMEINPVLEKQMGLNNVEGKSIRDLIPDLDPKWLEIFAKVAVNGDPERYEDEARIMGRFYKVSAYRMTKSENRKVAVLFSDITELKEKEEELTESKEKAEESDKLKSSFLTTISHEIRTPLNSILGFTGILLQERAGALNEEQKKQLSIMQLSGRHLLSLINNILDLSKIEAGQLVMKYEKFNLQEVIEEVLKLETIAAQNKGLSLLFLPAGDCGSIESDRQRVHQVLLNLLNNAVKFTNQGSVTIRCFKENNFVRIEISDTGIGIKEEYLNKIFIPFIQIDNDLIRKHPETGSGLGLSVTQKLVEILHGTISVKSEYEKGSTFTISLPVIDDMVRA